MIFNSVASRVQQALYAISSLFIAYPTPPEMDYITPLADLKMQVSQWAALALLPGRSRDIAKDTVVVSATHYKSHAGKGHEKLLIVLKTPRVDASPGKVTYVVTDRCPNADDKNTERLASSSVVSSPSSPSSDVRANDRISIPGVAAPSLDRYKRELCGKEDALCTVTFSTPISLAQLSILLRAVNDHSIHYDLWTYQCYWYAYTVWEVLRTEFGGVVTENEMQAKRGKYMGVKIRREDSVEAVAEEYRNAWRAVCEEDIRASQQQEEIIRQAEARGEARERERREQRLRELEVERSGYRDELKELDAYRAKFGPLQV